MPNSNPCLYIIDDLGVSHEVDLKEVSDIALTYCVNDLLRLSQPEHNFTKGITLLGTDRTNNILNHVYRVDKVNRSVLRKRLKVTLLQQGTDLLQGVGVLEISDIIFNSQTKGIEYECDLTAQGYNWQRELENLAFCDAGLGSHVFSETVARNSWDRTGKNGTPYAYDYIGCTYFPIHYGAWILRNRISIFDLRPHAYIRWLLEKAFETIGYTLTGSYIESEDFNMRVIPFGRGAFGPSKDEISLLYQTFQVIPQTYKTSALPTFLEATPALREIWYLTTWTQPVTYEMKVEVRIPYGSIDESISTIFDVELYVDDTMVANYCYIPVLIFGTEDQVLTYQACISQGQVVRAKFFTSSCGPAIPGDVVVLEGVQILFFPVGWSCYDGETIELCDTIDPDLNFLKILKGLVHSAGLLLFTNEEQKTVEMVRIADYYKTQPHEDWTSYLNCAQELKQSIVTDCINFKLCYLQDSGDKSLEVNCTEWSDEIFSQTNTNDPEDDCLTEFRNPTFAPMNSDGWQYRNEGGIHGAVTEDYGFGYNTYMLMDSYNTYNWSVDTWTQPYTCQVRVRLQIQSGLTATYHRWGIEVNGVIVADAPYDLVSDLLLVWNGCLNAGDEMKFKIIADPNMEPLNEHIEITNGNSNFDVNWRWIQFNDVANDTFFKPVFLTAQKNRPAQAQFDEMSTTDLISHDIVPRMAFYYGLVEDADINWTGSGSTSWNFQDAVPSTSVETQFPYGYFYDFYEATRPSLAFNTITRKTVSPETKGSSATVESDGVARYAYGTILDSLAQGVVLKVWARLTPSQIRNLDFGTPKYIKGFGFGSGLFILNRVSDWNPTTELGLCEFIQWKLDETFV